MFRINLLGLIGDDSSDEQQQNFGRVRTSVRFVGYNFQSGGIFSQNVENRILYSFISQAWRIFRKTEPGKIFAERRKSQSSPATNRTLVRTVRERIWKTSANSVIPPDSPCGGVTP